MARHRFVSGTIALGLALGFQASAAKGQDFLLPASPTLPAPVTSAAPIQVVEAAPVPNQQSTLRAGVLPIPNTSVANVGTQQIPTDATLGRLPESIPLPFGPDRQDGAAFSAKSWVAPVFNHQPTYFEDQMLENHGHERFPKLQPMISGARFYSSVFMTPYLYCVNGPLQDISSAGRYRPGSLAPALFQRPPYDAHALGAQALATGSGVMLIRP